MKDKYLTITKDGTDTLIINKFSWFYIKWKIKRILSIKSHLIRLYCWYYGHKLTVKNNTHSTDCDRGCQYPIGIKYLVETAKSEFRIGVDPASDETIIMILEVTANSIYKIVDFYRHPNTQPDFDKHIKELKEKYGVEKVHRS